MLLFSNGYCSLFPFTNAFTSDILKILFTTISLNPGILTGSLYESK